MFRRLHARRQESGAAAVEFALIVPLLVMLLLGITTAGLSYNNALGTTDAIREGARYGATTLQTPVPAGSSSLSQAVQQKTVELSYGAIPSTDNVCVKVMKGPSTVVQQAVQSPCSSTGEPATPAGLAATDCVVKVWARVPFKINIGVQEWNDSITKTAVARYERAC